MFADYNNLNYDLATTDKEKLRKITEDIEGITLQQQYSLIMAFVNVVFTSSANVENVNIAEQIKLSFDKILNTNEAEFKELLTKLEAIVENNPENETLSPLMNEFKDRMQIFATLRESKNRKKLESQTSKIISKYLGTSEADFDTIKRDEQETIEKIHEKENIEAASRTTLSRELKKFIAGITVKDKLGNNERGFLGVNEYVPFDEALNLMESIIGSAQQSTMSFTKMMSLLESYVSSNGYLSDVIKKLSIADQSIKNKFMTHMAKHNMSMKYMMYAYNYTTKTYELRVYDSNSNQIERILYDEWNAGLQNTITKDKLLKRNKKDQIIINKTVAEKIYKEFGELKTKVLNNKVTPNDVMEWLKHFDIIVDERTIKEMMEHPTITSKGRPIVFNRMFDIKKNTNGIFGGLAYKLLEYKNTPDNVVINVSENPKNHPFDIAKSAIERLAKTEAKFNSRVVTTSFMTGGKNVAGFVQTKFATDRVEELKYNSETRRALMEDKYSTNSMWLSLLTSGDKEIQNLLYVDHLGINAIVKKGTPSVDDNDSYSKTPSANQEIAKQGFFQDTRQGTVSNTYNGLKLRMARMLFPTMSDKKQVLDMYVPVLDLDGNLIGYEGDRVQIKDSRISEVLFEQLVIPELKRIFKFHQSKERINIEGYNAAAQIFLMIPELNNMKFDGVRVIDLIAQDSKTYNEQWFMENFKAKSNTIINNLINREVKIKLKKWRKYNIIGGKTKVINSEYAGTNDSVRFPKNSEELPAVDFVINNLISMSNMFQLIAGDMAFYSSNKLFNDALVDKSLFETIEGFDDVHTYGDIMKRMKALVTNGSITKEQEAYINENINIQSYAGDINYKKSIKKLGDNLGKRLASLLAPGNKLFGLKDTEYTQLFLKDFVETASNIKHLINIHYGAKGVATFEKLNTNDISVLQKQFPIIKDFFAIDAADAQEYTTTKEHIDVLYGQGIEGITEAIYNSLNKKLESQYANGVNESNKFTDKELKIMFQPIKPVYTGSVLKNGRMIPIYLKSSSFPLLPQLTEGLKLNKLRIAMEDHQHKTGLNVRAVYKTGAKVGATISEIDLNEALTDDVIAKSSIMLPRHNFRIQQNVPVHALMGSKDEVLIGTQLMKLLFGDGVADLDNFSFLGKQVTGRELLKEYNDTFGDLTKKLKQELFDELGLDNNALPIDEDTFLKNLSTILKEEAISRNYPQQDIDGLDIIPVKDRNGNITHVNFRNSIWLSTNSIRYEALLNSLITKKLIKLKLPGYSYVTGSQKGFEIDTDITRVKQSRMIYTKHWNGSELVAAGVNEIEDDLDISIEDDLDISIEEKITETLENKIKIFNLNNRVPYSITEFEDVNLYIKKVKDDLSIAVDNKENTIFGKVTAEFLLRKIDESSMHGINPKGFLLWDDFLNSNVGKQPKSKNIIKNRFNIAIGTLKALKNNGITSLHFNESYNDDFTKEFGKFLVKDKSSIPKLGQKENKKTIEIPIDNLIDVLTLKSQTEIQKTSNIVQNDKSYYRGQVGTPKINKDGDLVLFGQKDELYKKAGLPHEGVSMTDDLDSAIEYGDGQLETRKNLALDSFDSEQELDDLDNEGYWIIQIDKNAVSEIVQENNEIKVLGKQIVIPKGKFKLEQIVDGESLKAYGGVKQQEKNVKQSKYNKAQIFVPSRFRDNDGVLIDLFEGIVYDENGVPNTSNAKYLRQDERGNLFLKDDRIADELLNITSFRIPTSSHVSASQVEIAGFLPPESGDLMIVPKEFAVQKGLDYDIDKEFSYHLWHTLNEEGKIVPIENVLTDKSIKNQLTAAKRDLKAMKQVFNDTEYERIINDIKNDTEQLAKERDARITSEITNIVKQLPSYNVITENDIKYQYQKIRLLKRAEKQLLQNKLVRIHASILGNSEAQMTSRINKPLSMEVAEGQKELLTDDTEEFNSLLSDQYQSDKLNFGAVGQMGIGVYSNSVVFNSLLQQSEKEISLKDLGATEEIRIGNFASSGKLGRYVSILNKKDEARLVAIIKQKTDLSDEQKTKLLEKLSAEKLTYNDIRALVINTKEEKILTKIRSLSEVFGERQNTATDNEKAQIMGAVGVTSFTINVDNTLTLLGFDKGDVITDVNGEQKETLISYLLISQPIIKEYESIKLQRKAFTNTVFKTNKQLIKDLRKKYGNIPGERKTLTSKELYDNIKVKSNHATQVAVLDLYIQLEEISEIITEKQRLLGITKKGLDKTFVNSIELYESIALLNNNDIDNVQI